MRLGVVRKTDYATKDVDFYRQNMTVDVTGDNSELSNIDITTLYNRHYKAGDIILFDNSIEGNEPVKSCNLLFEIIKCNIKLEDYASSAETLYELEQKKLEELKKVISMEKLQKEDELGVLMSSSLEEQKDLLSKMWENYKASESENKHIQNLERGNNTLRPYWSELNSERNKQNAK